MTLSLPFYFWVSTTLRPSSLASVWSSNIFFKFGHASTGVVVRHTFTSSNAFCCLFLKPTSTFVKELVERAGQGGDVRYETSIPGDDTVESEQFLHVRGGVSARIALICSGSAAMPYSVTQCPRYVSSFLPNWQNSVVAWPPGAVSIPPPQGVCAGRMRYSQLRCRLGSRKHSPPMPA
jgi:hypothetical protein